MGETILSSKQLLLLSNAAASEDGNLLADPATGNRPYRVQSAIADLIKQGPATEVEGKDAFGASRSKRNKQLYAVITDEGPAVLVANAEVEDPLDAEAPTGIAVRDPDLGEGSRPSKIATVAALLRRQDGATLDELTRATSWLPHTMRAAMTGLRKKGYGIASTKDTGARRYRIVEEVPMRRGNDVQIVMRANDIDGPVRRSEQLVQLVVDAHAARRLG